MTPNFYFMPKTPAITLLGNKKAQMPQQPSAAKLETFPNAAGEILIPFICNEFTAICPITGQPDFAKFEILYIPDRLCVESKSLKFYLNSYRNHGAFHETLTREIANEILQAVQPKFLRVWGDFSVRGGISIKPLVLEWGKKTSSTEKQKFNEMIEQWDRLRYFDR